MTQVDRLWSDAWLLFRTHLVPVAWIVLPVVPLETLVALIEYHAIDASSSLFVRVSPSLFLLAVAPVWYSALVYYVASAAADEPIALRHAWSLGLQHWAPVFTLMVVLTVLTGIGFLLLVIPGFWIMIKLSFAILELLLARKDPIESMRSSWALTTGYGGMLFVALFLSFVLYFMAFGVFELMSEPGGAHYWFGYTLFGVITSLMGAFLSIFVIRVYDYALEENSAED